ncbi:ankyrin repeat-containing domain protein [Annulohypoxylon stygium]|nr:ankyrin repeat-containing domain protein [Annulohypoxylon stygium]
MVECLLQARANINDTTAANYTPFDFAVMANRTEVGVYLLQRGVDANRGASNGRSPIFCALRCQSYECIEMLLSLPEIELSIPDGEGNSVLHWVARMQDVRIIEIIRAVKPRGLTIEDANSEGETALDLAKRWAGITPEFLVAFQNLLEDIGAGWSDMNDGEEFFDAEENLMS